MMASFTLQVTGWKERNQLQERDGKAWLLEIAEL